jgi:hypothetical protein
VLDSCEASSAEGRASCKGARFAKIREDCVPRRLPEVSFYTQIQLVLISTCSSAIHGMFVTRIWGFMSRLHLPLDFLPLLAPLLLYCFRWCGILKPVTQSTAGSTSRCPLPNKFVLYMFINHHIYLGVHRMFLVALWRILL